MNAGPSMKVTVAVHCFPFLAPHQHLRPENGFHFLWPAWASSSVPLIESSSTLPLFRAWSV